MIVYDKKFENTEEMSFFIKKREYAYRSQVETIAELIAKAAFAYGRSI